MKFVKAAKTGYICASLVNILVGVLLLLFPESSSLLICRVIGAIILLSGAIKLFGYFANDLYRLAFQFDLALGSLTMLLGLLIILKPDVFARFLVVVAAVYVIINAVFTLQTAVEARSFGIRKWWLMLTAALLSGLLGAVLLMKPFEGAAAMTMLIGAAFILDGAQNLLVAAITVHCRRDD